MRARDALRALVDDLARASPGYRAQPLRQQPVERDLDEGADLGVAQLGLGLALELGLAHPHRHHCGETLADVLADQVLFLLLEHAPLAGEVVDGPGQGLAEPFLVGAAFMGVDVVGKRQHGLVVRGGPLQGHVEFDVVADLVEGDDVGVERFALGVEVLDEVDQAAGVAEGVGGAAPALVDQADLEALVEEGHLSQSRGDDVVVEDRGLLEDGRVGQKVTVVPVFLVGLPFLT